MPGSAKRDAENEDGEAAVVPEDEFGAKDYRPQMQLKSDHESRPIWIVSDEIMSKNGGACRKHYCFCCL